jgi:hypothetical protein
MLSFLFDGDGGGGDGDIGLGGGLGAGLDAGGLGWNGLDGDLL